MRNIKLEIDELVQKFPDAENKQGIIDEMLYLIDLMNQDTEDIRFKDADLAIAIADLSPYLEGEYLHKMLNLALENSFPLYQTIALMSLVNRSPHISPSQRAIALTAALRSALAIKHKFRRIEAILNILNRLHFEKDERYPVILKQTFEMAFAIDDIADKVKSLAVLSSHVPDEQRKQFLQDALNMTLGITDEIKRADALKCLSFYL